MFDNKVEQGEFVVAKNQKQIGFCIAKVQKILSNEMLQVVIADNKRKGEVVEINSDKVMPLLLWLEEVNMVLSTTKGNYELGDLRVSNSKKIEFLEICKINDPLLILQTIDPSNKKAKEELSMMVAIHFR